jgi:hypothetical protein
VLGYFRDRIYDPNAGQFLAEDPLKPFLYSYAANQPLTATDPRGRDLISELFGDTLVIMGPETETELTFAIANPTADGHIVFVFDKVAEVFTRIINVSSIPF